MLVFLFLVQPLLRVYADDQVTTDSSDTTSTNDTSTETTTDSDTTTNTNNTDTTAVDQTTQTSDENKDQTTTTDTTQQVTDQSKDTENTQTSLDAPSPDPTISNDTKLHLQPEVDNLTGALIYNYDIVVPPGRNNLTPSLSLSYNSSNENNDSMVGYGWSISIPYIERINRSGSDTLYSQDTYSSSVSGELVSVGSNFYAPKSEKDDFNSYQKVTNGWIVTDKNGTTFKYGAQASTREDDPNDSTKVYKWMLEEVRDTNNNFVRYEYLKDNGRIYPSRIVYTGYNTTDGIFEISFATTSRTDLVSSYKSAFLVKPTIQVTSITTKINGSSARKYDLSYTAGDNGNRSMLSTITETGYDENGVSTVLPSTQFQYQTVNDQWTLNSSWNIPTYGTGTQFGFLQNAQLVDVNGDGLPDFVRAPGDANDGAVWLNTGNSWTLS